MKSPSRTTVLTFLKAFQNCDDTAFLIFYYMQGNSFRSSRYFLLSKNKAVEKILFRDFHVKLKSRMKACFNKMLLFNKMELIIPLLFPSNNCKRFKSLAVSALWRGTLLKTFTRLTHVLENAVFVINSVSMCGEMTLIQCWCSSTRDWENRSIPVNNLSRDNLSSDGFF